MSGRRITDLSRAAQTGRESYRALRNVMLCAWSAVCGSTADYGSPYCAKHRRQLNAANARLYEERRQNDLCRDCGTQVVGRSRCWLCATKRAGYPSRQPEYRKMKERHGRRSGE